MHNTLVENRKGWRLKLANVVQAQVFREATRVLVISEGMERFYRSKYPTVNFQIIPHVFSRNPNVDAGNPVLRSASPKAVALCGNFNQTNLEATRRVIDALFATKEYQISVYTPVPPLLLRARGIDTSKIHRIDYVAENEVIKRLNEADLLVLTHGLEGGLSDIEYQTIFPTRTVWLLLAARPLLVHAPRNSFLAEYIRERGCGIVVDTPSEEAIQAAAKALTSDESLARSVTTQAAEAAKMFRGPVVKEQLLAAVK
jgi:hypothetical protein